MQTVDERTGTRRSRRARPRPRITIAGVIGELFITVGVVVLLYVAWQMYVGDMIYSAQNNAAGQALSEQWDEQYGEQEPASEPDPDPAQPAWVEPPVLPQPTDAETFAVMRIPRFGPDYAVNIAGGTTRSRTLDTGRIGHYTDAAMPGQIGNFSLAAHRTTYGAPFNRIAELQLNDALVVEVEQGWYTYRFRTLEYVTPAAVDVLLPVPQKPDIPDTGERYITLTSCSPMFSLAERIVAYGLFESFTPRADGPPAALTQGAV